MNSVEKQERKREAQRRLRSQRQRAGMLRSRVIVVSLVSFALLWGVVFVQMATGNDPVLGDSSSARVATSRRARTADRIRGSAKGLPAEADASTDSEEAPTAEAVETAEPEEVEPQPEEVEPGPVETELAEPEPEPAPVTTSQS
jgi:cytoskeletal protein RodZ